MFGSSASNNAMVDFVDNNSDQIVPDFTESTQLADNNNDDIESFDVIVPEEPHEEVILTPSVGNDVPEVSDARHHQTFWVELLEVTRNNFWKQQ